MLPAGEALWLYVGVSQLSENRGAEISDYLPSGSAQGWDRISAAVRKLHRFPKLYFKFFRLLHKQIQLKAG